MKQAPAMKANDINKNSLIAKILVPFVIAALSIPVYVAAVLKLIQWIKS